jgi:hypothetical protein
MIFISQFIKNRKDKNSPYVAPNLLLSRFNVAQINKVWTIDDVTITIREHQKPFIF